MNNARIILVYFGLLLLLAPISLLSFDTYYYWEWSRHLALSYYDGSPMIAYFIKAATLLFGDTLFALNFVGIASSALTCLILYKTARLFLSKEASYVALSLWLFSPLVTLDILKQTTYDTPLTVFWALAIYFAVQFIKTNKTNYLYLIGTSIGLLLLSKYSGLVLLLAFFIFLLSCPSYRYLFKTPPLYCALLLALALFSPVIIWNEQHNWQSFIYQLTTHQIKIIEHPFFSVMKSLFGNFVLSLNFMLLPSVVCWLKKAYLAKSPKDEYLATVVRLCLIICTTVFCFYLFIASKATLRSFWLSPYLISSALLGGYCFQLYHYRRSIFLLIGLYGTVSLAILFNGTTLFSSITTSPNTAYYHLIEQLNTRYPHLSQPILTPGWLEARMLFFLKNKPSVYSIDCGSEPNQYALWSSEIFQEIKNKTLKQATYIDTYDRINCIAPYFDRCIRLTLESSPYKGKETTLYVYSCSNGAG